MKILLKDEKLKTETINILSQLMCDANLDGKPEVAYSFWLHLCTCTITIYGTVCTRRMLCNNVYTNLHVCGQIIRYTQHMEV